MITVVLLITFHLGVVEHMIAFYCIVVVVDQFLRIAIRYGWSKETVTASSFLNRLFCVPLELQARIHELFESTISKKKIDNRVSGSGGSYHPSIPSSIARTLHGLNSSLSHCTT